MSSRIEALKFIREDKSEIFIVINILEHHDRLNYRVDDIYIREFRKKNRTSVKSKVRDDYPYRKLDMNERTKYMRDKFLEYVTEEQIKEAIMNAWELCKPNINSIDEIDVATQ